jgi:hypothetical protein
MNSCALLLAALTGAKSMFFITKDQGPPGPGDASLAEHLFGALIQGQG